MKFGQLIEHNMRKINTQKVVEKMEIEHTSGLIV